MPSIEICNRNLPPMIEFLHAIVGGNVSYRTQKYDRAPCTEHCPEMHVHVSAVVHRWRIGGQRAYIVLYNILPYLHRLHSQAVQFLDEGKTVRIYPSIINEMRLLGWAIPDYLKQ
jgi:hypothetical protein